MSTAHYTAGPWRVEACTNAFFDIVQVVEHGYGRRVATAHTAADANLIGAATDLLEALQAVHIDAVGIGHGENVITDATRAKVDAAIAKATGSAS